MAYTIPAKIDERLEEKLGREASIRSPLEDSKERLKVESSGELKKGLATSYDLKLIEEELQRIEVKLRMEMDLLREEMRKEIGVLQEDTHEREKRLTLSENKAQKIMIQILKFRVIVMLLWSQGTVAFFARFPGLME